MNIFLVGFMGSGKSTLGKELALALGYRFLDTDDEIQSLENMSISEIFDKKGEVYFRNLESEVIRSIVDENLVISTGGGTPCFYNNMSFMKKNGKVIWLQVSTDILVTRLDGDKNRPLLQQEPDYKLFDYIENKLQQREKCYKKADFVVNNDADHSHAISKILSFFYQ
ncbi:MAG: shikimate kinase [Saprospiraceae bacterium]|nr:shikimate kinase [Saprospiraceae bacterium]